MVQFLAGAFPQKSSLLVKHTLRSMFKTHRSTKSTWDPEAVDLLAHIVRSEEAPISWLSVSIRLFEESEGRFYETATTCREKWVNHLNPHIKRGEWSVEEELELLRSVSDYGTSWTFVATLFGGSRTDHMIKNHFKCLMLNQVPRNLQDNERAALQHLIKKKEGAVTKSTQSPKVSSPLTLFESKVMED